MYFLVIKHTSTMWGKYSCCARYFLWPHESTNMTQCKLWELWIFEGWSEWCIRIKKTNPNCWKIIKLFRQKRENYILCVVKFTEMVKLIRQTIRIVNIFVKIIVVSAKLMWTVKLYITIIVLLVKLMWNVKLWMAIIQYYTYIVRHEAEYLNDTKWINNEYTMQNNRENMRCN